MPLPHPRRALALAGAALVLTTLTSCAADPATTRVYTPAAGVNNRDASVDVLNAVVVSAEDGSGTFVASLVNNDVDEAASLTGIAGADQTSLTVQGFSQLEVPAGGLVNLAEEDPITVEGDFAQGDFVELSLEFGGTEQATVKVPVVTNCGIWAGLDGATDEAACAPATGSAEH